MDTDKITKMSKFSIVIPAYNEEQAIESIIQRTLDAAEKIKKELNISDVEIIVVNDGSADRTSEIAAGFANRQLIKLISYEKNKGYGAAIKAGFEQASGDLVSFLDADGTCDPLLFIDMLKKIDETDSDLVIGARLNGESRMPFTRKLGNIFYRDLVQAISSSKVSDIASGMRIIRQSALRKLYPLPDGLNFTPAMSVRAILDRNIKIAEMPIPYEERIGSSKLRVLKDGFRFLISILEIAFAYKPLRLFGFLGLLFLFLAAAYAIDPLLHYIQFFNVPEDRIYRLVFIVVAAVSGIQLLSLGVITQAVTNLIHHQEMETAIEKMLDKSFLGRLTLIGFVFILAAVLLNYQTIEQYLSVRQIHQHWSYVVTGGLLFLLGLQFLAFSVINRILTVLRNQRGEAER